MKRVSLTSRLGAAVAALGTTAAFVWALSGYAYPQAGNFQPLPMAGPTYHGACS
jgi:hypothetical protein